MAEAARARRGKSCGLDLLIDDIREELRGRPYNLVAVASGWKHLTWPAYVDAIRSAFGTAVSGDGPSQSEVLVLMCIAYFQPITRAELSSFLGKKISRDLIGNLRSLTLSHSRQVIATTTGSAAADDRGHKLQHRSPSCGRAMLASCLIVFDLLHLAIFRYM